jgi:hypothetical protein
MLHNTAGITWLSEKLAALQERLLHADGTSYILELCVSYRGSTASEDPLLTHLPSLELLQRRTTVGAWNWILICIFC